MESIRTNGPRFVREMAPVSVVALVNVHCTLYTSARVRAVRLSPELVSTGWLFSWQLNSSANAVKARICLMRMINVPLWSDIHKTAKHGESSPIRVKIWRFTSQEPNWFCRYGGVLLPAPTKQFAARGIGFNEDNLVVPGRFKPVIRPSVAFHKLIFANWKHHFNGAAIGKYHEPVFSA